MPAQAIQRAGKARHEDRLYCGAAGYEAGVTKPDAWQHIGRDMRRDAPPVCIRHRHIKPATKTGLAALLDKLNTILRNAR